MKDILKEHKIWFLIPICIILGYGAILIIFTYPISEYSISKAGQFGDSFGILNSMFSGFAFISLVITIYLQQKEMKDAKEEILKQNFENTFFKMIDLFNNVIKDLDFKCNVSIDYAGAFTISRYFNKIGKIELKHENNINLKGKDVIPQLLNLFLLYNNIINDKTNNHDYIMGRYEDVYKEFESNIGHYFEVIYQILKFIDEYNLDNKQNYSNLFRAQFSKAELSLLFYHSTSEIAKGKITPLLIKYEFFEHLNIEEIEPLAIRKILLIVKSLNEEFNLNYLYSRIFGENEKSKIKVKELVEEYEISKSLDEFIK